MIEEINEPVSVSLVYNADYKKSYPHIVKWHTRIYKITKIGLHYTKRIGQTLFHIFSVTDGKHFFRLSLNTNDLFWKLEAIGDDNTN